MMSKLKLELQLKDFAQLAAFATNHRNAMVGNLSFVTPLPTVAIYNADLQAYQTKLNELTVAEQHLLTLRAERDALRQLVESNLNVRGSYVESQSSGDDAKILSAAFELRAVASATTHIGKPHKMVATMGNAAGKINLSCRTVAKAGGYVSQRRDYSDSAAPGAWGNDQFSTRSSVSFSQLVTGQKYAFRTKAMGPNDLESPWSEEAIGMAP